MLHLDSTFGAEPILLPLPPYWSEAIAIETDFAPEELWLPEMERALFGGALDRFFGPPDERDIATSLYRSSYEKTGRNRGTVTVEFEGFDPANYREDLDASQNSSTREHLARKHLDLRADLHLRRSG